MLEAAARDAAAAWGVELGEPFALALHSFAAPAGDEAVLKVVPEHHWESDHEADALEHWAGDGAVRLLRHDRARRAFLIERALPGTDISQLPDDRRRPRSPSTSGGGSGGRRRAVPLGRGRVPRWLDEAEGHPLVPLARALYGWLRVGRDVLVHGDFHHHNILRSARGHSRSTRSRCSASPSTTSRRSSGTRSRTGWIEA